MHQTTKLGLHILILVNYLKTTYDKNVYFADCLNPKIMQTLTTGQNVLIYKKSNKIEWTGSNWSRLINVILTHILISS